MLASELPLWHAKGQFYIYLNSYLSVSLFYHSVCVCVCSSCPLEICCLHLQAFQQTIRGQMNIGVRGGMPSTPRYPTPIQRPVAYQQGGGAPGNSIMSGSGRHRPQHNSSHAPPSRPPPNINKMQSGQAGGQPYYGAHGLYKMQEVMKYQISVVGVVTRQWTGYPRTPSIPSRVRVFPSPKHPGWLLAPSSLLFSEYRHSLQWECEVYHSPSCSAKIEWWCACHGMDRVSFTLCTFFVNCTLWLMCLTLCNISKLCSLPTYRSCNASIQQQLFPFTY